jgi:predicted NBD/HSP70 family sugar kinase
MMQKATRQQTKEHNTNLVLKTIYRQGEISRAEVARITHLTRTTVSDIVADLLDQKLLEETGVGSSAGGKPPILLKVQDGARQLACLDLNGREYHGALINLRGEICNRKSIALDGRTGEAALQVAYRLVDELIAAAKVPLLGIGAGVAGLTDNERGVVRRSVSLNWTDLPLKQLLSARYSLPVYLLNDSHAAALAEYTFGEFRQTPNLIVVRIDQGIGAGIILSGQLHTGDGFGAGEIGHLTVVEGGRQCSCGNYGCLETVARPRAVIQRMQELAEYDWISFPSDRSRDGGEIDWEFVRQAFEAGDETITELVKEAGRYLGISIANLVSILNVEHIVITGRYVDFGDKFLQAVSSEVKHRALANMAVETEIVNSSLGQDDVLLGASALLLSKEIGLP